jgi:hypothetical protein
MMFFIKVDSLGYVLEIERVRNRNEVMPNSLIPALESSLIANGVRFFICYGISTTPGVSRESVINYARDRLRENNSAYLTFPFGFNGELIGYYERERERLEMEGIYLSKYDYLLMQIDKYLPTNHTIQSCGSERKK